MTLVADVTAIRTTNTLALISSLLLLLSYAHSAFGYTTSLLFNARNKTAKAKSYAIRMQRFLFPHSLCAFMAWCLNKIIVPHVFYTEWLKRKNHYSERWKYRSMWGGKKFIWHASICEWLPRESCLKLQTQNCEWYKYHRQPTTCNNNGLLVIPISSTRFGQNNCPKHVALIGITNKPLLLHLVGCLWYLYQWCTFKQISNCEW